MLGRILAAGSCEGLACEEGPRKRKQSKGAEKDPLHEKVESGRPAAHDADNVPLFNDSIFLRYVGGGVGRATAFASR